MRGPLLGRGQVGICMRSGKKLHRAEMVEDGQVKGLLVDPDWWEPYHPLLLPPPMRPDGLPRRRPAPDDSSATSAPVLTGSFVGGNVVLSWTASNNNETMIKEYLVYRATTAPTAVPGTVIGTVPVTQDIYIENDVDGSWQQSFVYDQPFTDDTLVAGNTYDYWIVGIPYYGGQASPNSNVYTQAVASGFVIQSGGGGLGYTDGTDLEGPYGTLVSGNVDGNTVNVFDAAYAVHPIQLQKFSLYLTGASSPPAQNLFTSLTFTDDASFVWVLDSSAATYATNGNVASWVWQYNQPGYAPFVDGDDYTIAVA